MPGKPAFSEEKTYNDRGIPRRDVLKIIGGAIGFVSMKPVLAKELLSAPEKDWLRLRAEGIKEIHTNTLTNKNERSYLFIRKGGVSVWEYCGEGSEKNVDTPISRIKEILEDANAQVEAFHTHPLKSISEVRQGSVAVEQKEPVSHPMPPSLGDMASHIYLYHLLGASSGRLKAAVVDPTGVWEYAIDFKNPRIRKLFRQLEETDRLFASETPSGSSLENPEKKLLYMIQISNAVAEYFPIEEHYPETDLRDRKQVERVIEIFRRIGFFLSYVPIEKAVLNTKH